MWRWFGVNLPLGGGNSNICYFSTLPGVSWSNLTTYFSDWLVQPPTSPTVIRCCFSLPKFSLGQGGLWWREEAPRQVEPQTCTLAEAEAEGWKVFFLTKHPVVPPKWVFPIIMVPPKSSILIGFSILNHLFWGKHPYFWKHPNVTFIYFPQGKQNQLELEKDQKYIRSTRKEVLFRSHDSKKLHFWVSIHFFLGVIIIS